MAVVVDYDGQGNPITSSLSGVGISDDERNLAYKLDKLLQKEFNKFAEKLSKSKKKTNGGSKNKVEIYWEFGSVLRKIFFESGLIEDAEKPLYWLNVKLHAPKELQAKDRGPNRIHVAYCFRLAGYPKKTALKREWSEWVYLFDSPSINKESRFDKWNEAKMEDEPDSMTRENTRLFAQCLNSILKDIETSDLKDAEILRCYEGAWLLSKEILKGFKEVLDKDSKSSIMKKILEKQMKVGELMDGTITPNQFTDSMINEIDLK